MSASELPTTPGVDVVLIDDDEEVREMLLLLLEARRMRVRAFASARAALEAIRARLPEVVVTDLALGGECGAELASTLRTARETSHLALIAVSGEVEPSWQVVRWFDAYLRKPVDVDLLPDLVESLRDAALAVRDRLRRTSTVPG